MQGIFGKLSSNFLIASFIPSLWFVVVAQIIFSPIEHPSSLDSILSPPKNFLDGDGFVTLVLTLLIGFTLMGLSIFIYKLLEGYFILEKIPFLRQRQYRKALKRRIEFEWRDKLADHLFSQKGGQNLSKEQENKILRLRQESRDLKAQYQQDYPVQIRGVLPTQFGNILKAFELYANENYGIDAVIMWPRLIHAIDPVYYKKVDQSNNGLAFVVNCMVLSFALVIMCLLTSGYHFIVWLVSIDKQLIYWQRGWSYLGGSVFFIGLMIFFYYASLPAAREYGNVVRSSFDLFRFDLLNQLHLSLPTNSNEEYSLWKRWSNFTALGQFHHKKAFEYIHHGENDELGIADSSESIDVK